jgi:hypothetical protein
MRKTTVATSLNKFTYKMTKIGGYVPEKGSICDCIFFRSFTLRNIHLSSATRPSALRIGPILQVRFRHTHSGKALLPHQIEAELSHIIYATCVFQMLLRYWKYFCWLNFKFGNQCKYLQITMQYWKLNHKWCVATHPNFYM